MQSFRLKDILNPRVEIDAIRRQYRDATPFAHCVIDRIFRPEIADLLSSQFPSHDADFWSRYSNPIEEKLTCNHFEHMPPAIAGILHCLNGEEFLSLASRWSGIEGLQADPTLHGGGMHCIRNGGKLDVHIDYSLHPHLSLERRMNLIVYLNKDWRDEYGGALELWEETMQHCEKRVMPYFNRAVVFNTGDSSLHGHPDPIECPRDVARQSIALYYLTEPQADATERYRARFLARPQDDRSPEMEAFRAKRSGLESGPKLYRTK